MQVAWTLLNVGHHALPTHKANFDHFFTPSPRKKGVFCRFPGGRFPDSEVQPKGQWTTRREEAWTVAGRGSPGVSRSKALWCLGRAHLGTLDGGSVQKVDGHPLGRRGVRPLSCFLCQNSSAVLHLDLRSPAIPARHPHQKMTCFDRAEGPEWGAQRKPNPT